MRFHIVVPYHNAQKYLRWCIKSIQNQEHEDWVCYLLNDASTDESGRIALETTADDKRFRHFHNLEHLYVPGNYAKIINDPVLAIPDDEVIVSVDGDDLLADSRVLSRLQRSYFEESLWLTWGSFIVYKNGVRVARGISHRVADVTACRHKRWRTSHLRTFRAFLFRAINPRDLKAPTGNYWEVAGDLAMMFPMLEMAGNEHAQHLGEINYIYNADNPISDAKVHRARQLLYEDLLRKWPQYPLLRR